MTDKTKEFIHCFTEIDARATVCPNCRQPQGKNVTSEAVAPVAKKKKRSPAILIALLLSLIAVCACLVIGGSLLSDADTAVESSGVTQPTARPQPTAPPIDDILAAVENMTDAQRNAYNASIKGSRVENWAGTVTEVNEGEVFGGFTVYVEMSADNLGADVFIDVDEETALSLQKGSEIVFSGDVETVSDILGTTVFVENATIQTVE